MIEHMIGSLLFTHSNQTYDKVVICFHCPACGFRNVTGTAWSERRIVRFLGRLTVMKEQFEWVKGTCCERQLVSNVKPATLTGLDADSIEVQGLVIDRLSPVSVFLLLGAYLLFAAPILGPIFLVLAWLGGGSSRPWFRIACRVALLLHLLAMNLLVIGFFLAERR